MKKIKLIIPIIALSVFAYLGYNVVNKVQYKNDIAKTLQTIPEFSFETLESKPYTKANLKPNTPTVFIYFNSDCEYCKQEAKSISMHLKQFNTTQLIFVSTEPVENIKKFATKHHLLNQKNITFLHDTSYTFANRFDAQSIPFLLIYNEKQELIKKNRGQLTVETILELLNT